MHVSKRYVRIALCYVVVAVLFVLGTALGNRTMAVFSELSPTAKNYRVVIDAGHGGEDGGAVSCTGRKESTYNLQIAVRLNELLHLIGIDTVMIRDSDTAVYTKGETITQKKVSDLKERVRIANKSPKNILISIHQNTFPEEKYSGAQVFYAHTANSEALAKQMQAALVTALNPGSNREAKKGSGVFLLDKLETTGILIECGFLSNAREESLLGLPEYQKKLCCVIASTLSKFMENSA